MTGLSLDEAQARLERKRAELARLPKPKPAKPREFRVPPITWPCPDCGVIMAGFREPETAEKRRCHPCSIASIPMVVDGPSSYQGVPLSRRSRIPLGDVLAVYRWPERYREIFDAYEYPRDARPDRSGVHLGEDSTLREVVDGWPWITLQGDVGAGKTALASHLMARLWRCGWPIHYRAGGQLPAIAWGQSGNMPASGALMVDDLEHGTTGAGWEAVAKVLLPWYATKRPLVITTNASIQDLYKEHPAIADRLRSGLVLTCRGRSRRR